MRDKCLDKPRKPMVPIKKLDIIFRRRYVPNTQFYFTNRKHALPKLTEEGPVKCFSVPKSQKLLSYIKYSDRKEKLLTRQRLSEPLHMKDNLKIAATRDISKRLYIEDMPDDIRAVVDIHPEFYTAIEGRSLRSFDDIKVYVSNIRMYAMYRQQTGYRRDLLLKLDQSMTDETTEYNTVAHNLKQHIKNFQKFLTEDYKKACAKIAKAEIVHKELEGKISEYIANVVQLTLLNNVIFKLDSIRNILKTYRTYLLFAAPLYWRQEFDESFKALSLQYSRGEFVTISGEFFTDNDLVEYLNIEKIVENARAEFKNPNPASTYFTNPDEMIYLFRTMELQSREYLIQLSKTRAPYKLLQLRIKELKESTKKELDLSEYYIDAIKIETERELYNEMYLQEKFMRILNESFYDTVASPDTLKLKICIEYVYEQIFGKCDEGHQTLRDPMKILEVHYEDYNLKLDKLDFNIVTQARKDFFEQDLLMMQEAYRAQRELKEFYLMTTAMNKAFLPPAHFKRPEIKKFMDKKATLAAKRAERKNIKTGERVKRKMYRVSAEDREDLLLFTDWCEQMNPAPFLREIEAYVRPTFRLLNQETSVPVLVPPITENN